jgi:brefeldin A-resistance guanine nucleotide exchange factor 1
MFSEVLFPLTTQLLKPEVYQSDPLGMSETRVRAAALLSKVFLHYLAMLSETDELLDLWLKIVTIMDRLMNSGQGDNLVCPITALSLKVLTLWQEEAVSENLKNMLLVMSNGGFLAPPDEKPEQEDLWNETWKRINRFQPNFFAELFPEEASKPRASRKSRDEREKDKENEKGGDVAAAATTEKAEGMAEN